MQIVTYPAHFYLVSTHIANCLRLIPFVGSNRVVLPLSLSRFNILSLSYSQNGRQFVANCLPIVVWLGSECSQATRNVAWVAMKLWLNCALLVQWLAPNEFVINWNASSVGRALTLTIIYRVLHIRHLTKLRYYCLLGYAFKYSNPSVPYLNVLNSPLLIIANTICSQLES